MSPRNRWFAAALIGGVVSDQLTKAWVSANLEFGVDEIHIVPGFFSLVQARNTGAAFSTMEGQMTLFHVFAAICVVVIAALLRQQETGARFAPFTMGMVLAGAMGNELDRIRLGYVVDFLKVWVGGWPSLSDWLIERYHTNVWPIFNVADSLLLVGVALFVAYFLFERETEVAEDGPVDEPNPTVGG
ncbi:MAG: signal peptidase II [Myxococcota bacterium]